MSNQEKSLLIKPNSTYYMVGDSTSTDNNRKYVLDARGYRSISKVKSRKSLLTKPNSTYYTVCDSTSIDNGNTYLMHQFSNHSHSKERGQGAGCPRNRNRTDTAVRIVRIFRSSAKKAKSLLKRTDDVFLL
jgi:hypothetical protein